MIIIYDFFMKHVLERESAMMIHESYPSQSTNSYLKIIVRLHLINYSNQSSSNIFRKNLCTPHKIVQSRIHPSWTIVKPL